MTPSLILFQFYSHNCKLNGWSSFLKMFPIFCVIFACNWLHFCLFVSLNESVWRYHVNLFLGVVFPRSSIRLLGSDYSVQFSLHYSDYLFLVFLWNQDHSMRSRAPSSRAIPQRCVANVCPQRLSNRRVASASPLSAGPIDRGPSFCRSKMWWWAARPLWTPCCPPATCWFTSTASACSATPMRIWWACSNGSRSVTIWRWRFARATASPSILTTRILRWVFREHPLVVIIVMCSVISLFQTAVHAWLMLHN